jgi:hypothetical protein
MGFGLTNKGLKSLKIAVKNAEDILSRAEQILQKIDCEGAESTHKSTQRYLRMTMLHYETHTKGIREAITKFMESGLRKVSASTFIK